MPKDPKKIKAPELEKYKKEGYKYKAPGEGGKEYYELPGKEVKTPDPDTGRRFPGPKNPIPANPKKYEGDIIKMIQDGYDPKDLVKHGIIHPDRYDEFKKYYDPQMVYTEPEPKTPTQFSLKPGLNVERRISPEASTKEYQAYLYPDPNKGYAGATTKYFVGEKEIETPSAASYSTGAFSPTYKKGSPSLNVGSSLGTVKPDVVTQTEAPLGTGISAYQGTTPVRIQGGQDIRNVGVQKEFTPERYQQKAKGGLVAKLRNYADGGDIPETDPSGKPIATLPTGNPGVKSTGGGLGNLAGLTGGGAGGPIGMATNLYGNYVNPLIEKASQDPYGRINTGSKFGDYFSGMASGAIKGAGKGAEIGSALGPLGMGIGAIAGSVVGETAGAFRAKKDRENIAYEKQQKEYAKQIDKQRQEQERQDFSRNQQLQERGFKKGGLVDKLSGNNEMDMMINKNNRNHLMRRINEVGHEAAMKEYNDYFAEENKPKRFSIKK